MDIKGKVTFVNLSGGFWGIEAEDGQKFQPVDKLPAGLLKEGTRIQATVKPVQAFGIQMWGQDVEIKSIIQLKD
jgi:hypothetical protein